MNLVAEEEFALLVEFHSRPCSNLVRGEGFEPSRAAPKAAVLPLDDPRIRSTLAKNAPFRPLPRGGTRTEPGRRCAGEGSGEGRI